MASNGSVRTGWRTLASSVPETESPYDNGFTPVTEWMDCSGITELRCPFEVRNLIGDMELIPAVEFADDVYATPTVVNIGSTWAAADGIHDSSEALDVSGYTDDNQLIRFGWVTRNDSTSSLNTCDVNGIFQYVGYARSPDIVADWSMVCADDTSFTFFPVTQWVPIETARRYRGTIEMRGTAGNLYVFGARQLTVDPANPGTGNVTSLAASTSSNGIAYPSSQQHITTSNVNDFQFMRFGFWVKRTSGAGLTWATVRAKFERMKE